MLIINADDFGRDSTTNKAIVYSFKKKLCSSTTIMPNMPGFEEACQLAHENKFVRSIGMHLVLDGGYPLTKKIQRSARFCDSNGQLCLGRLSGFPRTFLRLETSEKELLAEEIQAQVKKCRTYKIPLTHIDSHHHIHTVWAIASVVLRVIKEEGVNFMRIARNIGPEGDALKTLYKFILNQRIKKANLLRTDYFGSVYDYLSLKKNHLGAEIVDSCEIMIHPIVDDKGWSAPLRVDS